MTMLTLRNVTLGFDGRGVLLDSVNSEFAAGQLTALIGRNGSGKSTLLRAVAGLTDGYKGSICVDGKDVRKLTPRERSKLIAFVNTRRVAVSNLSATEMVAMGRAPYTNWMGNLSIDDRKIVEESLSLVGMSAMAGRDVATMSDGEWQRVMIARALAQSTPVVLLDEPTSFLDLPNRRELCQLLHDMTARQNKCVLFSTHELDLAQRYCDNVALIADNSLTVKMATAVDPEKIFD